MEKIKKAIKSKLSKFREEEKGDAMAILMFIGLKHYSLLYPDQPYVQMSYLKFLSEKYLMEAENPEQPSNFMRRQQLLIEANERKYRPDFMAHFPFADEYGSIGDVLSGAGTFPEVDLDHMGAPGRNRLIVKVFEEMRLDQRGIRISDLPEALDRLSIHVSPKLRRTLLKARGKDVNGPLVPSNPSHREGEPWEYMEKHQHKVDPIKAQSRAYYSRLQRIPSRLGHVIREHRFHHHQQQIKHDRDALHTIGSRRVDILTAQAPKLGFADPAYHQQQLDATQRQRNASLQRHGLLYQENPANQTTKLSLQAKSVEQRRLQRGAVRRLHQLDSGAATLEIADAFLQSNVGRELMRNSSRSGGAQYRDYYGEEDRDEDDEDEDADLSPKEAQARAAALLGLSSKTATDTRAKDTKSRKDIAASSSSSTARGTATTMNHNTATSSRLQEKVDHVAATKALYEGQSGWKATKGGWVADFGPAHTHPLYTGPDHYTPFLLDRKQDRELARSSAETDHSRGGQRRNGTHGHQATSDAKKMHRLDEADILFATSRPPASGGATSTTTTAHTASSSRHLNMHRHHRHFADAAEDEEYLNGDAEGDLGHDNDFLFLSEAAPTVLSPKPSATRSDRKATQAMQIEVESSPVSSDDAALYANATVGRSGVLDDSLDGPHDDNSEDDVDALMSRLQSSISLKDIASDNE
eukprot:gene11888-8481_t